MDQPGEAVDRLSSLPDELLSQILSLMPTKFAVRTSVLSKRWEHIWKFVSNLDFDDIHSVHGLECLSKFVDRVLNLSRATQIKLFRLNFVQIWAHKFLVSRWIDRAVSRNACEIDVNVILLEVPQSLFSSNTLTKLRLVSSVHDYHGVWSCASHVHLPRLKTLEVVVWSKPSENVLKLVRGCPVLESLSVEVTWRNDGEEYNFNVPTLKKLKLNLLKCVSTINRVVLNVPNLESLCIRGILGSFYVVEDLSSLVEATVSVFEARSLSLSAELLRGLSGVKSLSWSVPTMPDSGLMVIPRFLENSLNLEHLFLEMVITKRGYYRLVEPQTMPSCMQTPLMTVEVKISKGGKYELRFLRYVLSQAEVLKKLTVTTSARLRFEEEMELCRQLLKFPRSSRACEIHFCGDHISTL